MANPHSQPTDNTPRGRRIIQTVSDLRRGNFQNCRLVDLGCAHGSYALEFATRGARTLGIEGRASWIEVANGLKQTHGVDRAEFVQDDVRNLSRHKYGSFDVVLCCGLLYHLDEQDVFGLLKSIFDVCDDFAIVDTQISLKPKQSILWEGETYHGFKYREHNSNDSREAKEASLGSSLDDEFSFWLTKSSLLNALKHVGFTCVFEVQNPVGALYEDGDFTLHSDVVTFVAMKGTSVGSFMGMNPKRSEETEKWPEHPEKFHARRPWLD